MFWVTIQTNHCLQKDTRAGLVFAYPSVMRYNIFTSNQMQIGPFTLHYTTLGNPANPSIVLLQGYPETQQHTFYTGGKF